MSAQVYHIDATDREERQEHILMRSWCKNLDEFTMSDLRHQDRVAEALRVTIRTGDGEVTLKDSDGLTHSH
jgi:hypothetical protein